MRGILISLKLLAIFDTKVSLFQLKENGMTDSFLNTLKGKVRNFQKLKKRKYLIKYYIIKKRFCLKIHFFMFSVNLIFVVLHLKNRPSCSFRYFESSDVVVVKMKSLLKVSLFLCSNPH